MAMIYGMHIVHTSICRIICSSVLITVGKGKQTAYKLQLPLAGRGHLLQCDLLRMRS